MLYTGLDDAQRSIIESQAIGEVQKSQLESFAKYLNLPWDDLEEFTEVVKHYEDEFDKEVSIVEGSNRTKFYLENYPLHVFNHAMTESPTELRMKLNIQFFLEPAIDLINQKNWFDLKGHKGSDVNYYKSYQFLQKISIRIFNCNYLTPKLMQIGKEGSAGRETSQTSQNEFLPKFDTTTFNIASVEDFLKNRFEFYFLHYKPQIVACVKYEKKFPTHSGKHIYEAFCSSLDDVKNAFNESILPQVGRGSNLLLSFTHDIDIGPSPLFNRPQSIRNKSAFKRYYKSKGKNSNPPPNNVDLTEILNFGNLRASDSFVKILGEVLLSKECTPSKIIELRPKSREITGVNTPPTGLNEKSHTLCSVSIKSESELVELAKKYFEQAGRQKQETSRNEFCVGEFDEKKKRKIRHDDQESIKNNKSKKLGRIESEEQPVSNNSEDEIKLMRFTRYIEVNTTYCKAFGIPLSFITNNDEIVVLYIKNFYEKLKLDPENVFREWEVLLIKGDEYPVVTILSSIIMQTYKEYLSSDQITNSEVTNAYLTIGSCERKKILDMYRYLITRKLFSLLFYDEVFYKSDNPKRLPKFSWSKDGELQKILGSDETTKNLDGFIGCLTNIILRSQSWIEFDHFISKVKSRKSSSLKVEIVESTDFTVLKTLQNETWCQEISATVVHAKFKDDSEGVVKFLDINRLKTDNDAFVKFENGEYFKSTLTNVFYFCYRSFINEYIAYSLIGEQDFVPKVLKCGFVQMPELKPDSSIKEINLYEDPFVYHLKDGVERKLKTESPFFHLEFIPKVTMKEMKSINFDKLEDKALDDLSKLHKLRIYHRNICPENIIIKKCNKSKIGYRVVFLGFGLSAVARNNCDKYDEEILETTDDWNNDYDPEQNDRSKLSDAISHYEYMTYRYEDSEEKNLEDDTDPD